MMDLVASSLMFFKFVTSCFLSGLSEDEMRQIGDNLKVSYE